MKLFFMVSLMVTPVVYTNKVLPKTTTKEQTTAVVKPHLPPTIELAFRRAA